MKRMGKQAMQEFNWTPGEFYDQDYFELTDMLSVGDETTRLVDPSALFQGVTIFEERRKNE